MGIAITVADAAALPAQLTLRLECDACPSPTARTAQDFRHPDGYVVAYSHAMAHGWMERQGPQGRLFVCPRCSGKPSTTHLLGRLQ